MIEERGGKSWGSGRKGREYEERRTDECMCDIERERSREKESNKEEKEKERRERNKVQGR